LNPKKKPLRAQKSKKAILAFTLVELMVVVAIIGILMVVALPAYNNYALKSKFTEVTLATAPIKTFVSTCAVSGDCVSAGAISLGGSPVTSTPATHYTSIPSPMSVAQFNDFMYSILVNGGATPAQATQFVNDDGAYYAAHYVMLTPSSVYNPPAQSFCFGPNNGTGTCYGLGAYAGGPAVPDTVLPLASVVSMPVNPAITPTAGGGAPASVPCVGPASGCSPSTKYVAAASSDSTGVITAAAVSGSGFKSETFVLVPSLSGGRVDWTVSGTCKTRAGGALC